MKILGIKRGGKFSPNMQSADEAIIDAVRTVLEQEGHEVELICEDQLNDIEWSLDAYDRVFCMARNINDIERLSANNSGYDRCINPLKSILLCSRRTEILRAFALGNIYQPSCIIVTPEGQFSDGDINFPLWVKRGEGCSEVKEDTTFVTTPEELNATVQNFQNRGINSFVLQEHLSGDLIKFYGVAGTDFFKWSYASDGHSKFGLESINGAAMHFDFSEAQLHSLATAAATLTNTPVYGGDAVVTATGEIFLIDFNDWPSFKTCREEAAKAISQIVINK